MDIVSWMATAVVLIGFVLNSYRKHIAAFTTWIVGDVLWIIYDLFISNYSHLVLSGVIIVLNLYGIYRFRRKVNL